MQALKEKVYRALGQLLSAIEIKNAKKFLLLRSKLPKYETIKLSGCRRALLPITYKGGQAHFAPNQQSARLAALFILALTLPRRKAMN